VDNGERSPRTLINCEAATELLTEHISSTRLVNDLGPEDFAKIRNAMMRRWGAIRVRDFVQRIRSVFKFAVDEGLIERAPRYGQGFALPSKRTLRLEKKAKGPKMFEADEVRRIIAKAKQPLKAMILLGINIGFGNADCSYLPLSALDLDGGWVNFHRVKTGIDRRCPLWPETVAALREWLTQRPEPSDPADAGLVFITNRGNSWLKDIEDNPISKEMRELLNSLKIDGYRNFYALRHTFETIGGECKDQVAVDAIMGHVRDDMASHYRERISDQRLQAVVNTVHGWVFTTDDQPATLPIPVKSEVS
jgi:integrase